MRCPIKGCNKETVRVDIGETKRYHCGSVRLLSTVEDHYLTFEKLPEELPSIGCPICGSVMKDVGRFSWIFPPKEDGLERMFCDKDDHYVYVTKEWHQKNRILIISGVHE